MHKPRRGSDKTEVGDVRDIDRALRAARGETVPAPQQTKPSVIKTAVGERGKALTDFSGRKKFLRGALAQNGDELLLRVGKARIRIYLFGCHASPPFFI